MKKQSGFTLIELMVVMAIIAILATAGLAAYTGYLKKARDATRIADIQALNNIVLGSMASTGIPPADVSALITDIHQANNNLDIKDPLSSGTAAFKSTCLSSGGTTADQPCVYMYKVCTDTTKYNIAARFESSANLSLYTDDAGNNTGLYEVGNCSTSPSYDVTPLASGTSSTANDVLDDN